MIIEVEGVEFKVHPNVYFSATSFGKSGFRDHRAMHRAVADFCTADEFQIILRIIYGFSVHQPLERAERISELLRKFGINCNESRISGNRIGYNHLYRPCDYSELSTALCPAHVTREEKSRF